MKRHVLLILFVMFRTTVCRGQQTQRDTVYVLFDTTSTETCQMDSGREVDSLKVNKFRKINTSRIGLTFFHICDELFVFNKKSGIKDTVSIKEIPIQNIVSLNYMIKRYNSLDPKQFKHHVFDTIYVIEKLSKNKIIKYEVGWNDKSLGIIE